MNSDDKKFIINNITSAEVKNDPFTHIEIDNFLPNSLAKNLSEDFLDYQDEKWFCYKNQIEDKKLLSDWRQFPAQTYQMFSFLNSPWMLETLSNIIGCKLYADNGLHGGGWHMHASGGKLNPHLDYSIHPNLGQLRKLNLIIYLCEDWKSSYGGHFGLWGSNERKPGKLIKEVEMGFNKAVLFDTTQNSWHGLSREVTCPSGSYRKSLAVYYLTDASEQDSVRGRALFATTEEQKGNKDIEDLIEKRSDINKSKGVYIS
jgi:Rps23 Pro-64 3,4-dihydroxylase Tpa1-like proline 4-hydroxylase